MDSIIVLIIFCSLTAFGQKIQPEIKKLAKKIEKYNELESEYVNYAGITTDQYRNFEKLRDKATIEELLLLLKHKNSVVKGYASWALADKMYPEMAEIFAKFLKTGETVANQHGCIMSEDDLATEFYDRVFYQHFQNKLSVTDSIFFQSQILQLDSVILYRKRKHYLLERVLSNNDANPNTYERIKQLAKRKKNSYAIIALAKYGKQSDIPFIIKQGKASFSAISVFPDKEFWEFLLSYKSKEKSLNYFLAISSYKNDNALSVLNDIYINCNSNQVSELDEALIVNYCPLFQDLILQIWEEHKTIDVSITKRLINDCPKKSSKAFADGLLSDKKFNFIELDYNYGVSRLILPLMLQHISKYNSELMLSICNKNILTSGFTKLKSFLDIIKKNEITQTSNVLIQSLKERKQAFDIFHITETLLSFNNIETKKQITKILITNQKNWDWGNWSDHFRKLFKEFNIKID